MSKDKIGISKDKIDTQNTMMKVSDIWSYNFKKDVPENKDEDVDGGWNHADTLVADGTSPNIA